MDNTNTRKVDTQTLLKNIQKLKTEAEEKEKEKEILLKLSKEELELFKQVAQKQGISLSSFIISSVKKNIEEMSNQQKNMERIIEKLQRIEQRIEQNEIKRDDLGKVFKKVIELQNEIRSFQNMMKYILLGAGAFILILEILKFLE